MTSRDLRSRPDEALIEAERELVHKELEIKRLEEQLEAYRAALTIIATTTYPARYLGRSTEGVEMYGGSNDASDFAQQVLASYPANRHFDGTAAQAAAYQRVHEHYASDPAMRFQCQVGPGCENATPDGPCCGILTSVPVVWTDPDRTLSVSGAAPEGNDGDTGTETSNQDKSPD